MLRKCCAKLKLQLDFINDEFFRNLLSMPCAVRGYQLEIVQNFYNFLYA